MRLQHYSIHLQDLAQEKETWILVEASVPLRTTACSNQCSGPRQPKDRVGQDPALQYENTPPSELGFTLDRHVEAQIDWRRWQEVHHKLHELHGPSFWQKQNVSLRFYEYFAACSGPSLLGPSLFSLHPCTLEAGSFTKGEKRTCLAQRAISQLQLCGHFCAP